MRGILSIIFTVILLQVNAQGINFQGVARSANGTILASSNISLRLSIISKNVDATPEYVESKTVVTNAQGIFSIVVGDASGTSVNGNFKNIVWSDGPKFLKVEMDPSGGTNFINMGATQLQYVPYSFYSFSVDASGVKGILPIEKGGTGVGSLVALKTALNIPASIDTNSLSRRIDNITSILNEDSLYNIKLGKNITSNVPSGYWNIGIGGSNLLSNTTGDRNIGIGAYALASNTTGRYNVSVGSESLSTNSFGWNNVAFGLKSLQKNTGTSNSGLGTYSLGNNISGNENIALGYNAGAGLTNGSGNVFLGSNAGNSSFYSTVNNKLVIANSVTSSPLIYGDFANRKIKFNADIDSLNILNRINFVDENANDHINKYDTGYNSPLIYSRYFYGHYGDLIIQGMSKTYTGNIHFVTGSNMPGYESPRQRMVIMDNGNVGIGDFVSSPPTSKLQVSGVVTASGYKIPGGTSAQYLRADGTVTTSVTSGVPYTGASQAVDLGAFDMKVNGITVGLGGGQSSTNSAFGNASLSSNNTGIYNTAVGQSALAYNTSGQANTALGLNALRNNTTANGNVAIGAASLQENNASYNIAIGLNTLQNNTSGQTNIGLGFNALLTNTTSSGNIAIGAASLQNNNGGYNIGIGLNSMQENTLGTSNVAIGYNSLWKNVANSGSTAIGYNSMQYADNRTTGRITGNTAIGYESLKGSMTAANNTGINNTAVGASSLFSNTTGSQNSAFGGYALNRNTSGSYNTALGRNSMYGNTTGSNNISIGDEAMVSNTTGAYNIAIGNQTLFNSSASSYNTVIGYHSLFNNTGNFNTVMGYGSMAFNTTGNSNLSLGSGSLNLNTTGSFNTAVGSGALMANTTADNNVALGLNALGLNTVGYSNTAVGAKSLSANLTGVRNTAIGDSAFLDGTTYSNSTAIGYNAQVTASNQIKLGDVNVTEVKTSGTISSSGIRVGTISPTTSAVVEINSTTQGLLPPRMTQTQRDAISSPATGLVIFNTTSNNLEYKSTGSWVSLSTSSSSSSSSAVFLPTIVIGTQQWMRENLDVVTYRNGDIIPEVTDPTTWASLTSGAWCYVNNDASNGTKYGKLYNWYAITDPRGLAPNGWHIPTDAEWTILTDKLGGLSVAGGALKQAGTTSWLAPNGGATNASSFSALPGSYRINNGSFETNGLGDFGAWWSISEFNSSNAWMRLLDSMNPTVIRTNSYKSLGLSVRCIRD